MFAIKSAVSRLSRVPSSKPRRVDKRRSSFIDPLEDRTLLAHDFGFAIVFGDTNFELGGDVATDSANNAYITGSFQGTIEVDPGVGTTNLTSVGSWDAAIAKYDPNGALVWAKRIGGSGDNRGISIAVDDDGSVFLHGRFDASMDLDPGPGTSNVTSAGGLDAFVIKFDTNGDFLWGGTQGGTGSDSASFSSIAVDGAGDVYTTGVFTTSGVDLDPGPGVFAPTVNGGGFLDVFVSKLDGTTGNLIWANGVGGSGPEQGHAITVDNSGNVYAAGTFEGSNVDLDPGAGTSVPSGLNFRV